MSERDGEALPEKTVEVAAAGRGDCLTETDGEGVLRSAFSKWVFGEFSFWL